MLNRVILEGRLGADPERRETPNGKVVVRLALPLFNPYQKEGDRTEWVQCEVWNQPAEFIAKNGKKGHLVSVEGRLRNQRFTDKDGNVQYRNFISVDRLTLLEPKNRREQTEGENTAPVNNVHSSAPVTTSEVKIETAGTSIDDLFKDFDGLVNG